MNRLSPTTRIALEKMGFTKLTEVQEKSVPLARAGKDFWARSPTGTGKTAAFLIPLIERAAANPAYKAIVLEPSRELAIQVANEARKVAFGTNVRVVAAYGGSSHEKLEELVRQGAQIISGTPERVAELLEKGALKGEDVKALVLDEADRLFSQQLEGNVKLVANLAPKRQTMLFSVHAPSSLVQKARAVLKTDFEDAKAGGVLESKIEHLYSVAKNPMHRLAIFLQKEPSLRSMVFCATIENAREIEAHLKALKIFPILLHSKMPAESRNSAVRRFRQEKRGVLVATDLAARGMHFEGISRVYSMGVPPTTEFYLHRAGRTGRMGASGKCISIVSAEEENALKKLYAANGITASAI